jgi:carbamoyltransferase
MNVLGLSFGYHDSSVSLVRDGKLVFASAEERLTRQKHDASFPIYALQKALEAGGITLDHVDQIVYHEDPYAKFSRVLASSLSQFPRGYREFSESMKSWAGKKLWTLADLESRLPAGSRAKIVYLGHHFSHALQAFLGSGFESSAILIVDAVGDWSCSALFRGAWKNGEPEITPLHEIAFPHSLGLVYSAVTAHVGFVPNDSECTTMALAAFGKPRFYEELARIVPEEDGLYSVDQSYFNFFRYYQGAVTEKFIKAFGPPRDIRKQPLPFHSFLDFPAVSEDLQRYADLACSMQKLLEDRLLGLAGRLKKMTGETNLCLAGGVAMNCVANQSLANARLFDRIFVPPDPGDGGTSIGSAFYAASVSSPGKIQSKDLIYGPYTGCEDQPELDVAMLDHVSIGAAKPYAVASSSWSTLKKIRVSDEQALCDQVTTHLMQRKVVGWYQGRSEFGPRALGNRSILIRPDCVTTAKRLSREIKERAGYRPYALSMSPTEARRLLVGEETDPSMHRWMQFSSRVHPQLLAQVRAGVHIDETTRPQVCSAEDNPRFHRLLKTFGAAFGAEVLLNTSFNPSGYPLVNSTAEALLMFFRTTMDVLVLGNWLLWKE